MNEKLSPLFALWPNPLDDCEQAMDIKHFLCFGPCMVEEGGLEQWRDAAREKHALYYPILVNRKDESWRRFLDEALGRFTGGTFAGTYQQSLIDAFNANLAQ